MTDDFVRMMDRLMDRVDRLENGGETESEIAIEERATETVAVEDATFVDDDVAAEETVSLDDDARATPIETIDAWQWGDARWGATQFAEPKEES